MKKFLPILSILLAMLIWSVSGIAIKYVLVSFPSSTFLALRFSLAVLLLLLVGLVMRGNSLLGLQKVERKDMVSFLLCGIFQPCLYYLFETFTYQQLTSPTIAEALLSISPILAPVFAWVILRERVTRNNITGIVISTVGMLLMVLVGAGDFSIGNPVGVLTALISVSLAVMYSVMLRRIPSHYNSLSIVFYTQLTAVLFFVPLWLIKGAITGVAPLELLPEAGEVVWGQWTPTFLRSVVGILYLAVFSTVVAFILFCYTVRQMGITTTNVFNNVRPAMTAVIMWLVFQEHLPWEKIVGIALVIVGLFISQRQQKD